MRIDYQKIISSDFNPGNTSNWVAKFGSKNGADSLNFFNGYAPIQDYSFEYKINTFNIKPSPLESEIEIPYLIEKPRTIQITFYDTHKDEIFKFFLNNFRKTKTIPKLDNLLEHTYELIIQHFDLEGNITRTTYLNIYPKDNLTDRGDQDWGLKNIPISFSILGFSEK